jgi:hypothetical protein
VVAGTVLDYSGREQSRELIVTRVDTPEKQTAGAQVPPLQSIAINIPLDIPAVNSGEEERKKKPKRGARRKTQQQGR